MDDFLEKWRTDNKFKAKVKLALYGVFMIFVIIYASILQKRIPTMNNNEILQKEINNDNYFIALKEKEYNYTINIEINDEIINYTGTKTKNEEKITKTYNDKTQEFVYMNDEYYQEINDQYTKVLQNDVYDIIKYNYIDLDVINEYTKIGTKENEQYKIYLKDVILGNSSENYFTITINENEILIDYTNYMKEFNNKIEKYIVDYKIEEKE